MPLTASLHRDTEGVHPGPKHSAARRAGRTSLQPTLGSVWQVSLHLGNLTGSKEHINMERVQTGPVRDRTVTLVASTSTLLAAVVTLIATVRGPGISPDSVEYLSSGLNLAEGHGLRDFGNVGLTLYPPGLPGVVAAGHWVGFSAEATVRALNAGAFGCIVWLGFLLLRRHVRSRLLLTGSTFLLAVSLPLLSVAQMAWTEPVFIVMCLCFILVLEDAVRTSRPMTGVIGASGLVWLAFIFRYVGIALIAAGALALIIGRMRRGWRASLALAACFVVTSAIVPVLWLARNHGVDGTYMGPRPPSYVGILYVARYFGATLDNWLLPPPTPVLLQRVAEVVLVLGLGLVVWRLRDRREALLADGSVILLVPLIAFVGTYWLWIVVSELTTEIDAPGTRLLSPLYVPLVVLGAAAVDRLVELVRWPRRREILSVGVALLVLFVFGQALAFGRDARASALEGLGYGTHSWQSSPLVQAARRVPANARLYSNDPWALWAVLRRQALLQLPAQRAISVQGLPTVAQFTKAVGCKGAYLAWFTNETGRFTPGELARYVQLNVVAVETDGTLFKLGPLAKTSRSGSGC